MILTGQEIKKRVESGQISIEGFNDDQLNPNSYNLTLNKKLKVYVNSDLESEVFAPKSDNPIWHPPIALDMKKDNPTVDLEIGEEGIVLNPGIVYLARVNELSETHGLVPMLEGRSSIGRLGIEVHISAGFGDTGFKGYWTLEISCVQPVRIYADVEICQMYYLEIKGEETTYEGKYQNQMDVKSSHLFQDNKFSNGDNISK